MSSYSSSCKTKLYRLKKVLIDTQRVYTQDIEEEEGMLGFL